MVSGANNTNIEVYTKNHINNYQLTTLEIKKTISWLNAADLDANGAIDLFMVIN